MILTGKEIRLGRLFSKGRNAVVVAIDHGEFDGPLPGMTDLPEVVKSIDPGVSAVLLSPGMLQHCGHVFSHKGAPLAIVRLNWSTVYCFHWNYNDAETVPAMSAGDAVAAGADLALISLTLQTGSEARDAANVKVFCDLAAEARRLGMPIIGECFPARSDKLSKTDMREQVYRSCRILAELGADLIKTFYTAKFREVTESCLVPILGLGAEKMPKQSQALELAERVVEDGGRGVVFGRNAIQVRDPAAFQRALCDVVQDGVSAAEAAKRHRLKD
jgi:DhnA family fructose-bisphosphate aldolase class Ia